LERIFILKIFNDVSPRDPAHLSEEELQRLLQPDATYLEFCTAIAKRMKFVTHGREVYDNLTASIITDRFWKTTRQIIKEKVGIIRQRVAELFATLDESNLPGLGDASDINAKDAILGMVDIVPLEILDTLNGDADQQKEILQRILTVWIFHNTTLGDSCYLCKEEVHILLKPEVADTTFWKAIANKIGQLPLSIEGEDIVHLQSILYAIIHRPDFYPTIFNNCMEHNLKAAVQLFIAFTYMPDNRDKTSKDAKNALSELVPRLLSAAEQGNADAQIALGYLYESGQGVERNLAEAIRLYNLAANSYKLAAEPGDGAAKLQEHISKLTTAPDPEDRNVEDLAKLQKCPTLDSEAMGRFGITAKRPDDPNPNSGDSPDAVPAASASTSGNS
jgi:hypothetical protein